MNPPKLLSRTSPEADRISLCGPFYLCGGILFRDEETRKKLEDYFGSFPEGPWVDGHINHGGLELLLGVKDLGDVVQFVSRGSEWGTHPGYAHMCVGQVPKKS